MNFWQFSHFFIYWSSYIHSDLMECQLIRNWLKMKMMSPYKLQWNYCRNQFITWSLGQCNEFVIIPMLVCLSCCLSWAENCHWWMVKVHWLPMIKFPWKLSWVPWYMVYFYYIFNVSCKSKYMYFVALLIIFDNNPIATWNLHIGPLC